MSEFPAYSRAFVPGSDLLLLSSCNSARSNGATGLTTISEWAHDPSAGRISTRLGNYLNVGLTSGMVAPLTGATFTNATGVLALAGAFTNYRWQPGDAINITGGTGVTTGFYEITSKIDSGSIQLNPNQPMAAGNPADVAGTLVRAENPADVVVPAGVVSEGGQVVIEVVGACGSATAGDLGVAAVENTGVTVTGAAAGVPTAVVTKTGNFASYTFTTGDHVVISNADTTFVAGAYPVLAKTSNDTVTIGGFGWAPTATTSAAHAVLGKYVPIEFRLMSTALDGYSSPVDLLRSDALSGSLAAWRPNVVIGPGTCSFRLRYTISTVQSKSATTGQTTVSAELWHSFASLSTTTNCSGWATLYRSTMFRNNVDLRSGARLMPMIRHYANTATFIGNFNSRNITAYLTGPKLGLN